MIKYNGNDEILCNIAAIAKKRLSSDCDITLCIDDTLGEFDGKICDGVISAGSYSQLLDTLGRYIRNPKIQNGSFHTLTPFLPNTKTSNKTGKAGSFNILIEQF